MDNSQKIILDLCGGTGSWSKPYRDAGYDVRVITLPDHDITKVHISPIFKNKVLFPSGRATEPDIVVEIDKVHGILAAPPCTMFSIARTTAFKPHDLVAGMETVEACLRIIWECRKKQKLAFWALENPKGILRQFLGKPPFTFQPNDFGDLYTKGTDLWGYYNFPKKAPVDIPDRINKQLAKNNRILPKLPEGYTAHKITGERSQAVRRSITPPGFTQAFFKANP